ncbi:allophanate hydrolase subunit 1 [Agromyces sp. MMS24-JH15]|uniref:5-oxoprolinase subunit B family protein n=1 Tax=Agromyces sp. MMS24-JH15 TaxID=3243765 RepID=UPI00374966B5
MSRRILPSGETALLVECDDLADVLVLHDLLAADRPHGLIDLVPAARTVLVGVDPRRLPLESAAAWIRRAGAGAEAARPDTAHPGAQPETAQPEAPPASAVVPVVYDGEDLAATADLLGLSPEALAARHRAAHWRVAFIGFAPGFAYLVADDWPFEVPRLDAPRTRVPAGALGLAGPFSGAYPRQSPGGWRLIGRTDAVLWDPDAPSPALLAPGTRVRFEAAAS